MDNCYLCGKKFNDKNVKKHDEHIIQQSIGGNLTENDILCSKCGGKLGEEIDESFSKIFKGIATRLNIKTDRNNSKEIKGKYVNLKYKLSILSWTDKRKKMTLFDFQYQYNQFYHEIGEIDVIWKDFKVYPLKPFHKYIENNKKVIIYANQITAKYYRKKVENEISKKYDKNSKPEIIICDDLVGIIQYPFNMDNQAFKRGLAKIAIGFALKYSIVREKLKKIQWFKSSKQQTLRDFNYQWIEFDKKSNINREELPLVLEIDNNTKQGKIKDEIFTIQFYPLGIIDRLIEIQKNEFEHYPFHNLILFTLNYNPNISNGKKVLICYIELFSTFQWYVVLNDEYYGESIYEYYAQNILKKDDYIVNIDWRRYYKEREIYLQPLRITEKYIDKKYNDRDDKNKSCWDIEEELIQEETIKKKYKLDFENYLHNIISGISNQVLLVKQKQEFLKPELKDTHFDKFFNNEYFMSEYDMFNTFENMQNFKQNLDLFFSQKYNEKYDDYDEIFSIDSYRKIYIENSNLKNYTDLTKYAEVLNKSGAFKAYGHKKMFELEQYIQEKTIKQKMK